MEAGTAYSRLVEAGTACRWRGGGSWGQERPAGGSWRRGRRGGDASGAGVEAASRWRASGGATSGQRQSGVEVGVGIERARPAAAWRWGGAAAAGVWSCRELGVERPWRGGGAAWRGAGTWHLPCLPSASDAALGILRVCRVSQMWHSANIFCFLI